MFFSNPLPVMFFIYVLNFELHMAFLTLEVILPTWADPNPSAYTEVYLIWRLNGDDLRTSAEDTTELIDLVW